MIQAILGYFLGIVLGIYGNIYLFFILLISQFLIYLLRKKYINENVITDHNNIYEFNLFKFLPEIKLKGICAFLIFFVISFLVINGKINYIQNILNENDRDTVMNIIVTDSFKYEKLFKYEIKILNIEKKKVYFGASFYCKEKLSVGEIYKIYGKMMSYDEEYNKGGFNQKIYNYSKNNFCYISQKEAKILGNIKKYPVDFKIIYQKYISKYRERIRFVFKEYVKNDLALGVLLGDVVNLSNEIKEGFKEVNIYHMLAVSGTHIGYIIFMLNFFFKNKKGKSIFLIIILGVVLFIFSSLVKDTPSVIRASTMAILFIYFKGTYLNYKYADVLLLTFFINIVINPFQITNIGMYLSYLGSFSIWISLQTIGKLRYFKKIYEKILENKNIKSLNLKSLIIKIVKFILETFTTALSVHLIIFPIIAYFWFTFSLNFVLANMLVSIPLMFVVIFGFILIIISFFNISFIKNFFILNFLSKILGKIINILLIYVENVVVVIRKIPKSLIYVKPPRIMSIIAYYLVIYLIIKCFVILKIEKKNLEILKKKGYYFGKEDNN